MEKTQSTATLQRPPVVSQCTNDAEIRHKVRTLESQNKTMQQIIRELEQGLGMREDLEGLPQHLIHTLFKVDPEKKAIYQQGKDTVPRVEPQNVLIKGEMHQRVSEDMKSIVELLLKVEDLQESNASLMKELSTEQKRHSAERMKNKEEIERRNEVIAEQRLKVGELVKENERIQVELNSERGKNAAHKRKMNKVIQGIRENFKCLQNTNHKIIQRQKDEMHRLKNETLFLRNQLHHQSQIDAKSTGEAESAGSEGAQSCEPTEQLQYELTILPKEMNCAKHNQQKQKRNTL